MFRLIALFALVSAASAAAAAKYPAGVDPSRCPNFPICDNAALHAPAHHAPAHHWAPQAYHAAPQWAPAPQPQWYHQPAPQAYHAAPAPAGGDKFPAGVSPHACPNYPYCDVNAGLASHHHARAAPLPGFTERLYPAGVSPAQCPNYPEC